jgi:hypothetical protein
MGATFGGLAGILDSVLIPPILPGIMLSLDEKLRTFCQCPSIAPRATPPHLQARESV